MTSTTFHTYPDLIIDGGRLAATEWRRATAAEAVAATLRLDPEAIILRTLSSNGETVRGYAPGGIG
jgi:hypothetical protein